jgi:hypothetical protein
MGPYIHSLDRTFKYFMVTGMDKGLHMWWGVRSVHLASVWQRDILKLGTALPYPGAACRHLQTTLAHCSTVAVHSLAESGVGLLFWHVFRFVCVTNHVAHLCRGAMTPLPAGACCSPSHAPGDVLMQCDGSVRPVAHREQMQCGLLAAPQTGMLWVAAADWGECTLQI